MRKTTTKATNESGSAETRLPVKNKEKTKTKNTSTVRVAQETSQQKRMLALQERAQATKVRKTQRLLLRGGSQVSRCQRGKCLARVTQ